MSKKNVSARGADRPTMNRNRRTRERVRLVFWACLTLVCLLLVVVARQQQESALERRLDGAENRAKRMTNQVIRPQVSRQVVSQPIGGGTYQELLTVLQRKVLSDERVARVLVWGPGGGLVFSTEGTVSPATDATAPTDAFEAVSTGRTVSTIETVSMAGRGEHDRGPTDLFSTFVPLRTDNGQFFGAVQIDHYYGDLADGSSRPWGTLQAVFFAVAAICAVMVVLSFWWSSKPMNEAEVAKRLDRATLKGAKAAGREQAKVVKRDSKAADEASAEIQRLRAKLDESDKARDAAKEQAKQLQEQARAAEQQVQAAQSEASSARRAAEDASEALRTAGETERQLRAEIEMLRMEALKVPEPPTGPSQEVYEAVQADLERAREEVQEAQQAAKAAEAQADELRAAMDRMREDSEQAQQDAQQASAAAELARQQADDALGRLDALRSEADQARAAQDFASSQLADAQRKLDEAPATTQEVLPAEASARIEGLEEQVRELEAERAMLRAGRPETVYEVKNRELQDEIGHLREQLAAAETQTLDAKAMAAGLAPNQLAVLEERLSAAEARADEAERRLHELDPNAAATTNGNGAAPAEEPKPEIDGSELRSKLVRVADRKRLGADQKPRR
jgi:predicted  nucleic acid-binding Zn-ribbon protein